MLLQLKPLFMGEKERLPVDAALDLSALEYQGERPFQSPVKVTGEVINAAEVVTLRMVIRYRFDGRCDRCAEPFSREEELEAEHILVSSLENEDNDDFLLLENYQLQLDEVVVTDLLLALPTKHLCREDCRGLCPRCGKNLNEGLCGCREDKVDPRLAVLAQLMDGETP